MVYISKTMRYVIEILTIYTVITVLQTISKKLLIHYYTLNSFDIENLNLTEKEKKFYYKVGLNSLSSRLYSILTSTLMCEAASSES